MYMHMQISFENTTAVKRMCQFSESDYLITL